MGLFTWAATFHFLLCIFVCVNVRLCVACMCELCEGLALRWWFIATGSGPICFRSVSCSVLASLQRSPSRPDVESGWDPFKSAWNQHRTHMHAHTHKPLSLALLSSTAFYSFTNSRKRPAPTRSNNSFTPPLLLSLSRHISCFRSAESSLKHSVTCKHPHRHAHTHLGSHTHSHMDYIDYPFPAPSTTVFFVFSWCHVGLQLSFFETHSECAGLQDLLA